MKGQFPFEALEYRRVNRSIIVHALRTKQQHSLKDLLVDGLFIPHHAGGPG